MTTHEITRTHVHIDNIPRQLKQHRQWVVWRLQPDKRGKMTKVPYAPNSGRRRRKASHSDADTWGTFNQALACWKGDVWYTGIGVTLVDGLVGVDMDGFPQQRQLPSWAQQLVTGLNTYTEWSPSGHGIHMLAWGQLPPGRRRTGPRHPHAVEMYDGHRFFTVTGDTLEGYGVVRERSTALADMHAQVFGEPEAAKAGEQRRPTQAPRARRQGSGAGTPILSDDELLARARAARNGPKFARLWKGDASAYTRADGTPDASAADQALCNMLAFYTRDRRQIDRLFSSSKLMRPKWHERHAADGRTYGEMTIDRALSFVTERYTLRGNQTARGRNGQSGQDVERDIAGHKAGKQRKTRLRTDDYARLYAKWGYTVRLNLCNDDVEVNGEPLSDVIDAQIRARVRDYGITNDVSVNIQHATEALLELAQQNAYHPIKAYLETLKWDGKDYIGAVAAHFQDREGLFSRWYRHWQVGAVAKVYERFQNPMLVLDGPQNIGKSYFAAWLCAPLPGLFNASAIYPDNKDHKLRLTDTLIWEVEELGATTRRADVEALKAFITLQAVRERKPYGRRDIIKPALVSFIGTINSDAGFLVDRTGNRRFLVCTLTDIDWSYAQGVDVNQLWAQALHVYRESDDWRLSATDQVRRDRVNENYMVDDPIEAYIIKLFRYTGDQNDFVTLAQIHDDLSLYQIPPTTGTSMGVARVMRKLGAQKERKRIDGERPTIYRMVQRKT